jgi:hypothetical protein
LGRPINKPDGHPKLDGCGCAFEISPVGASANFQPTQFFHGSDFWSTRSEPDPFLSLGARMGREKVHQVVVRRRGAQEGRRLQEWVSDRQDSRHEQVVHGDMVALWWNLVHIKRRRQRVAYSTNRASRDSSASDHSSRNAREGACGC